MKKRFSFESKIAGILLLILGLVTITGLFAYRRFTDIVADVTANARPNIRLVTAEALLNSLYHAELSVKSFSLTKDTTYLEEFYIAAKNTDEKLAELRHVSNATGALSEELDTMDILVTKKIAVLNKLLNVQDQYNVQKALNRVIDDLNETGRPGAEEPERGRMEVLGWLFRKKEPEEKIVTELSEKINEIKQEEQDVEQSLQAYELELMLLDEQLSKRIDQKLKKLESAEMLALAKETADAEEAVQQTNKQIAVFCFATGTLLLFMAVLIINYVRNNNRYRVALRNSRREAEEVAETKQRFLANMSHEIRTPMNAIAGFTEQISKGTLDERQREQLNMVQKSTAHLIYLINEVLDFSKLQADKLKLETIGFRPAEVVQDALNFMHAQADEKKLNLSADLPDDLPGILLGDPFRLRQILLNLVSNAVKFTEKGSVALKVKILQRSADTARICFSVTDTGIGMDHDQVKKVFKEFEQADVSTSRTFGGSGLGLSIVNMLVTLHYGKIHLSSEPGQGTTVSVELDYKIGSVKDLKANKKVNGNGNPSILKQLRVLVVDDEEYNRRLLTTILKNHDATFREACNGQEALSEVKKKPFDIILMDARMPLLSGIEATEQLRQLADETRNKIPVIALTAAVTKEDKDRYTKAGMNGFLAKPFKEQELINEIARVMKNENETTGNEEKKPAPPIEKKQDAIINLGELQASSNGDVEFYIDMLELFIDSTRKGMEEIQKAFTVGDWERMANQAHKISSPCRHISARQLYACLKEIETRCRAQKDLENIGPLIQKTAEESQRVLAEVEREKANEKAK